MRNLFYVICAAFTAASLGLPTGPVGATELQPSRQATGAAGPAVPESPWAHPERSFDGMQFFDKLVAYMENDLESHEPFERHFGVKLDVLPSPVDRSDIYYVSEKGKDWYFGVTLYPARKRPPPESSYSGSLTVDFSGFAFDRFCVSDKKARYHLESHGWKTRLDPSYKARGIDQPYWYKRIGSRNVRVYLKGGPCIANFLYLADVPSSNPEFR